MKHMVPKQKFVKIHVIIFRNIGDILLCTLLLSRFRELFPQAEITALVNSGTEAILTLNPDVDKVLVFDLDWKLLPFWKRVAAEFKFAKKIYRAKYKLVFNLTEGDRGSLPELISRDAKCIGWNQNETGYWGKKYLFHDLVNPNLLQKVGE